jgi:hypothetical protein
MRAGVRRALTAAVCLIFLAVPVLAHHSPAAEFDQSKTVRVTGVLTKVDWINPHVYWYVDAKDESGKTVMWSFEGLPPGMLHRGGVTRDMLKLGETVTVTAWPAKDHTKNLGFGKGVKYADGHELVMTTADLASQP